MNSAHDLDTWRLFFQVVNLGSVSKAAQSLHQETSAISRKLNKLEKDLGTEVQNCSQRTAANLNSLLQALSLFPECEELSWMQAV